MKPALIRDGILLRSILVTILAFCLVGVGTVAYTMQAARTQAEAQSRERIEQLLDTVQSTLRVACFVKDRELAREVAQGLLSNSVVLRVTIRESGNLLADLERRGNAPVGDQATGRLVRDIHSPFIDGEVIGAIQLTPDPEVIERHIRAELVARSWQLVWQLALIAGVMVVTLLAFVIHPISAISRELHLMDPTAGERLKIPTGHARTEIGRLVTDVNALAGRLVLALDEEHALRLQRELDEQKYHAIFDNAESGIFIVERNGHVVSWNPALARLLEIAQASDFAGELALADLPWADPSAIAVLIEQVFSSGETAERDLMLQRHDHSHFWLNIVLSPVGGGLLQGVAHDVSALKEAEADARRQAMTDPLTGLANRASLEHLLGTRIRHSLQHATPGFTLLHIDLDKFRQVTEGIGVPAGDEILRVVARRLGALVKGNDTLARLSADIFAVILQNLSDDETIDKIIDRLMVSLRQPYLFDGSPIQLTASIGITLFPNDAADAPSLLRNAELACDKAKNAGGNQSAFFAPNLAEAAEQRRHLESDLRLAVRNAQFELYCQPIADLASRRVSGAEGLIRWRHPERGLVPPDRFIPIAEQTGLINEIGLWVIDTACRQLAQWQDAGITCYLSVNVSGRQIPNGLPPSAIADAMRRHGVAPERLALEITEGVLLNNIAEAQAWLQVIKQLGLRVYLDDFGTGYSSLSYLKRFPLDTLKIDRSFIQDMQAGNSEHSLVEAIIAMARSLGLTVVAEGVENAEQLQMLSQMGCHYAQGYHLARPLPPADFTHAAKEIDRRLAQADGQ